MKLSQHILEKELKEFDKTFKEAVKSQTPLLDRIMKFIVNRKGKQMRPMFVLLSGKLCGEINQATYRTATLVELLHTATLVHDDVVDESLERRSFFSTYALWKNKISVLVGDYLLAKGLLLSLDNNDFRILQILTRAVREMSEGELLQIEKSRNLNLDESIYFDIIRGKTASLIASACSAGAYSTSQNELMAEDMRIFGEKIGLAFQIKDDLFDYGSSSIGKPTGNDIKEKKLTLPLIYTLNNCDQATRKKLIYKIKNHHRNQQSVREIIEVVKASGGIEYTENKMLTLRDEALTILHRFPNKDVVAALEELVRFTTDRTY